MPKDNEISLEQFMKKHQGKLPKDLPKSIRRKLLQDAKWFSEHGATSPDLEKALLGISESKKAYPNYSTITRNLPTYDLNKWLQTMRDIQYQVYKGQEQQPATERATKDWDPREKQDFEHWMSYYQSGEQLKYKVAQMNFWTTEDKPGYFVPLQPNQSPSQQIQQYQASDAHPDILQEEKRDRIEKQRQKIISRLDSAEKLLRSSEGQLFVGREFENLLQAIHQLKVKILTVNKLSASNRLYIDMIIREANILQRSGLNKSANLLHKIAQDIPLTPPQPNNPTTNEGLPGTLTDAGPVGAPQQGHAGDPRNDAPNSGIAGVSMQPPAPPIPSKGMEEFLEELEGDDLEVEDDLQVEAQFAPNPKTPSNLEVNEPIEQPNAEPSQPEKDYDVAIEQALDGITIADVVAKLEEVAKIFKVREISRQLALVDMMLDKLGLVALFPTLAEASNKSLESTNYMLSRIEQVLAQLRGLDDNVKTPDLTDENVPPTPEAAAAKQSIEQRQEAEQARKQRRKEIADQALAEKAKPEPTLEVAEDLSAPLPTTPVPPPSPVR
jgi:hypothetical protein